MGGEHIPVIVYEILLLNGN